MTLKSLLGQNSEKCLIWSYGIIYFFTILYMIYAISAQKCFDDGNEFCIDKNDFLSVNLLPGLFLFNDQTNNTFKTTVNEIMDGSFDRALNKMDYHRKRMNEYLCHGYMAEEIFKEMSTPRVKRRPESQPSNLNNFLSIDNVSIHERLLEDEGSSKYKSWLQRTTMLDDIYRHHAPHKTIKKKQDVLHDNIEEIDGEITGYAMQAPLPSGKIGFYESSPEDDMLSSSSGHHTFHYGPAFSQHGDFGHHGDFFPSVHEEYYYAPQHHYDHHEEDYHKPSYSKGKGHELSIRDFFEIALTALAFLAFGLFIIQLLMNATNNNPPMMMATTGRQRSKRYIIPVSLSTSNNEDLNDLSYRVLRSIEAIMIAERDSGNCLRRVLCEDNRYSKQTNDGRRIWIPVWSLGMSWLSSRILYKSPWSVMLDSVKASVLGLGGIDCASMYTECNLDKNWTRKRHRKRRK